MLYVSMIFKRVKLFVVLFLLQVTFYSLSANATLSDDNLLNIDTTSYEIQVIL